MCFFLFADKSIDSSRLEGFEGWVVGRHMTGVRLVEPPAEAATAPPPPPAAAVVHCAVDCSAGHSTVLLSTQLPCPLLLSDVNLSANC